MSDIFSVLTSVTLVATAITGLILYYRSAAGKPNKTGFRTAMWIFLAVGALFLLLSVVMMSRTRITSGK